MHINSHTVPNFSLLTQLLPEIWTGPLFAIRLTLRVPRNGFLGFFKLDVVFFDVVWVSGYFLAKSDKIRVSKTLQFFAAFYLRAISPFKVIQGHRFGTNRKLIYDFLLTINNLFLTLHRFGDIAFDSSKIVTFSYPFCV